MNIGVDIDDTIVYTTKVILKYADLYNKEILGKEKNSDKVLESNDRFYLNTIYGFNERTKFDFFNKYYKNILEECTVMDDVSKVLNKLKEEGHKIYFITARITNIKDCDTFNITKDMLEKNNIPYDYIIMDASNKLDYAKENNINIFIDDIYNICKDLQKNGIKSLLMTSVINKDTETDNIDRVYDWNEVYTKICDFKK